MSAQKVVFEPSFATKPMGFLITKVAPGYGHQNLILIVGSNLIISYINLTQGLIWLSVTKSDTPETWKKGNFLCRDSKALPFHSIFLDCLFVCLCLNVSATVEVVFDAGN